MCNTRFSTHPMNQKLRYPPFYMKWRRHQSSNHQTMTRTTALNTLCTTKYTKHTLLSAARFVCSTFLFKQNTKKYTHTKISMFFLLLLSLPFVAFWGGIAWYSMASCRISIHSQSQYRCFLWVECNDYYLFLHLLE